MEKLLKTGKAKAIGVSNFSKPEMERLISNASVQPAIHQFEGHPWLQQREFADWNKSKGIHVTHYSPFGNQNELYSNAGHIGKLIDEPILNEIGQKHNKNSAQVALGKSYFPLFKRNKRNNDVLTSCCSLGYHEWLFGSPQVQDAR